MSSSLPGLSAPSRSSATGRLRSAATALRAWSPKQWVVSVAAAALAFLVIGVATVLIPNPVFGRDIAPVWWNYPVLAMTSLLTGMLVSTYVNPGVPVPKQDEAEETKSGKLAIAGGFLAWFAVGCPVCNKIALLALGYSGAITWFAPIQPFLGITALVLTAVALVWRLDGQVACRVSVKAVQQ